MIRLTSGLSSAVPAVRLRLSAKMSRILSRILRSSHYSRNNSSCTFSEAGKDGTCPEHCPGAFESFSVCAGRAGCAGQCYECTPDKNGTNVVKSNDSSVKLAHHVYGEVVTDKPSVVIIHGLMGSSNNWHSLAKVLCKTGRKIITVDARNHGASPHCEDMNYFLMSDDVLRLMDDLGEDRVTLMGHSMGGRASMVTALTHPERVEDLVVVDVSPRAVPVATAVSSHAYLQSMLKITSSLCDAHFTTLSRAKQHGDQILQEVEPDVRTRQFLLTNLVHRDNRFQWRVNLDAVINNITVLSTFPDIQRQYHAPTLLIGGRDSKFILPSDLPKIKQLFPQAEVQHIDNAGHWVHADKPSEFLRTVTAFLTENDTQRHSS